MPAATTDTLRSIQPLDAPQRGAHRRKVIARRGGRSCSQTRPSEPRRGEVDSEGESPPEAWRWVFTSLLAVGGPATRADAEGETVAVDCMPQGGTPPGNLVRLAWSGFLPNDNFSAFIVIHAANDRQLGARTPFSPQTPRVAGSSAMPWAPTNIPLPCVSTWRCIAIPTPTGRWSSGDETLYQGAGTVDCPGDVTLAPK